MEPTVQTLVTRGLIAKMSDLFLDLTEQTLALVSYAAAVFAVFTVFLFHVVTPSRFIITQDRLLSN